MEGWGAEAGGRQGTPRGQSQALPAAACLHISHLGRAGPRQDLAGCLLWVLVYTVQSLQLAQSQLRTRCAGAFKAQLGQPSTPPGGMGGPAAVRSSPREIKAGDLLGWGGHVREGNFERTPRPRSREHSDQDSPESPWSVNQGSGPSPQGKRPDWRTLSFTKTG